MSDIAINSQQIRRYKLLKMEHSRLRALESKNFIQADIECRFLGEKDSKRQYQLKTTNYRQTNNEGFHGLSKDLQILKSNIVVSVSEKGMIEQVLNIEEIKTKWQSIKDKIMDKHKSELYGAEAEQKITELVEDKEQFASSIRYLPPFVSLFSGFSAQTDREEHYREKPFFIAKDKMPIILKSRKMKNAQIPDATEIIAKGKLDSDNYEQPEVAKFVKTARDNLTAKSDPQLRYIERYAFSNSSLPVQALCMSTVAIPGFLQQNETNILKEVL